MRVVKLIFILLVSAVFIIFALFNTNAVNIYIPFYNEYSLEIPLFFFFFISVVFGVLLGGINNMSQSFRQMLREKNHKKVISRLEKELISLKSSDPTLSIARK